MLPSDWMGGGAEEVAPLRSRYDAEGPGGEVLGQGLLSIENYLGPGWEVLGQGLLSIENYLGPGSLRARAESEYLGIRNCLVPRIAG